MSIERIIDYDNLPMGSVWDGSPIQRTSNCDGCGFLLKVSKDGERLDVCGWGVAWKILSEVQKARKCLKIGKKPPGFNVMWRINRRRS